MAEPDHLHRFVIEHSRVRGELVQLDATWQALLERSRYPAPVRRVLGETLAGVALLAATIKFEGSLILQTRGDGPLHLLVVQANADRSMRGLARWHGDIQSGTRFSDLMGQGHLVLTIDPGAGKERYQGIVELEGEHIAGVLEHYFFRSEQLPTRLWLAADERRAAGLLLQDLPGSSDDRDAWRRSVHLAETITERELIGLAPRELLFRLYHEEDVRLFRPQPVRFHCGCSRERVASVLRGMGREEITGILSEQGAVSVDCEFCSRGYRFDAVDVEQLFAAGDQPEVGATRH